MKAAGTCATAPALCPAEGWGGSRFPKGKQGVFISTGWGAELLLSASHLLRAGAGLQGEGGCWKGGVDALNGTSRLQPAVGKHLNRSNPGEGEEERGLKRWASGMVHPRAEQGSRLTQPGKGTQSLFACNRCNPSIKSG